MTATRPEPPAEGPQDTQRDSPGWRRLFPPQRRLRAVVLVALLAVAALVVAAGMDLFGIGVVFTLVAVALGALGEQRLRRLVERALPFITPGVFTIVGIGGYALGVGPGDKAFYAASAQILPVLILGLTIEAGIFANRHDRFSDARVSLLSMFLLGIGEVAALRVLARGYGGPEEFLTVIASIAAAFAGLAASAVADRGPGYPDA